MESEPSFEGQASHSNVNIEDETEYSTLDDGADYLDTNVGVDYSTTNDGVDYETTNDGVDYSATNDGVDYSTSDGVDYSAANDGVDYSTTNDGVDYSTTNDGADYAATDEGNEDPAVDEGTDEGTDYLAAKADDIATIDDDVTTGEGYNACGDTNTEDYQAFGNEELQDGDLNCDRQLSGADDVQSDQQLLEDSDVQEPSHCSRLTSVGNCDSFGNDSGKDLMLVGDDHGTVESQEHSSGGNDATLESLPTATHDVIVDGGKSSGGINNDSPGGSKIDINVTSTNEIQSSYTKESEDDATGKLLSSIPRKEFRVEKITFDDLVEGLLLRGVVKSITKKGGAFVDIGLRRVDGLIAAEFNADNSLKPKDVVIVEVVEVNSKAKRCLLKFIEIAPLLFVDQLPDDDGTSQLSRDEAEVAALSRDNAARLSHDKQEKSFYSEEEAMIYNEIQQQGIYERSVRRASERERSEKDRETRNVGSERGYDSRYARNDSSLCGRNSSPRRSPEQRSYLKRGRDDRGRQSPNQRRRSRSRERNQSYGDRRHSRTRDWTTDDKSRNRESRIPLNRSRSRERHAPARLQVPVRDRSRSRERRALGDSSRHDLFFSGEEMDDDLSRYYGRGEDENEDQFERQLGADDSDELEVMRAKIRREREQLEKLKLESEQESIRLELERKERERAELRLYREREEQKRLEVELKCRMEARQASLMKQRLERTSDRDFERDLGDRQLWSAMPSNEGKRRSVTSSRGDANRFPLSPDDYPDDVIRPRAGDDPRSYMTDARKSSSAASSILAYIHQLKKAIAETDDDTDDVQTSSANDARSQPDSTLYNPFGYENETERPSAPWQRMPTTAPPQRFGELKTTRPSLPGHVWSDVMGRYSQSSTNPTSQSHPWSSTTTLPLNSNFSAATTRSYLPPMVSNYGAQMNLQPRPNPNYFLSSNPFTRRI